MGSYIFERTGGRDGQQAGNLAADVELALGELDWVDAVSVRTDEGDGKIAVADVHFDPDWPDTANADLVAEVFARYGIHVIEDPKAGAGRVSALDPLRASASVDDGIDLFVFDE